MARAILLASSVCLVLGFVLTTRASKAQNDEDDQYNPQLFPQVAVYLEDHYLDRDRIVARDLIQKTFAALENSVDEIFVENSDPDQPFLAVNVDSKVQVFDLNTIPRGPATRAGLRQAMGMLRDVFDFLEANYNGDTPLGEVQYSVLNGFLSGLDPHTLVFSPKAFREFFVHIEGEIFGVGMYVGTRNGKLQVIEVLKDTPAFRAKFRKGDIIAKIGDESTINMTVQEAVERIRGPRGSEVVLTVKRASAADSNKLVTLPIAVERNRVVIKSVESKLMTGWDPENPEAGGIGYVVVKNFDKNTNISLRENLERLQRQNGGKELAGLILDLRGNSGGLLTQAVEMCDFFLEGGSIVSTATRGKVERRTPADDDGVEPEYPIVALADSSSASGAEIVVGALQKNHRAVFLGTPTFGKGSVQQLHRLPNDAQLKITVSEYLIPGDVSIQENGVVPDILAQPVVFEEYLVPAPLADREDPDSDAGKTIDGVKLGPLPVNASTLMEGEFDLIPDDRQHTEKDYAGHIVSRFAKEEFPSYTLSYFFEPFDDDPDSDAFISGDLHPEKDKLVTTAVRLLRLASQPFHSDRFLAEKKEEIEALQLELFDEVVAELKKKSIDWTSGPEPSAPKVSLSVSQEFLQVPSPDEDDSIAINQAVLTARVKNLGDEPLYRLKGITRADSFLFKDREILFGKVNPGETVERRQRVRLPYYPHARSDLVTIELSTATDQVIDRYPVEIVLEGRERPRFSYRAELRDAASGEPLETLRPGVNAQLVLKFHNTGDGTAHKGICIFRNETGRQVFLNKGRKEFDELRPGAEGEVIFEFEVRNGDPVEVYKFAVAIVDSYSGVTLERSLEVPAHGAERARPFPNGKQFAQPEIEAVLRRPDGADGGEGPVLVSDADFLTVEAEIRSPTGTPLKAWILRTLLNSEGTPPDKIVFADSKGKDRMTLRKRVPLRAGVNLIIVFAKDQDGLESRRNLVVRRPAPKVVNAKQKTD